MFGTLESSSRKIIRIILNVGLFYSHTETIYPEVIHIQDI
jgi:hypothetical protein